MTEMVDSEVGALVVVGATTTAATAAGAAGAAEEAGRATDGVRVGVRVGVNAGRVVRDGETPVVSAAAASRVLGAAPMPADDAPPAPTVSLNLRSYSPAIAITIVERTGCCGPPRVASAAMRPPRVRVRVGVRVRAREVHNA